MSAAETGPVTVVEGTTFCLSSPTGDVVPGTSHGLFFRDARVLSRWELRLDGEAPHPLSVSTPDAYAARFVLRRPPAVGLADSTLLVVRDRAVGDGLQETLTLTNLGREATALTVAVHLGADFADLFAVKEGRPVGAAFHAEARPDGLVFTSADGNRGLRITATGDPLVTTGSLVWRTVIAPRSSWTTVVLMQPTAVDRQDSVHLRPEEGFRASVEELSAAFDHVAFSVQGTMDELMAELERHDVAIDREPFDGGWRIVVPPRGRLTSPGSPGDRFKTMVHTLQGAVAP